MFEPRYSKPERGNPFYNTISNGGYSRAIKGKPTDPDCDVLHNCVGYAYGRFHEAANRPQMDLFDPVNAENIFANAQQHGLKTGSTPKVGALVVWQKGATLSGSDGAGHVAFVEEVGIGGDITTSESGYGAAKPFWNGHYKAPYNYGNGYKLLGFVYLPEDDGKPEPNKEKRGIDISWCQPKVDWSKVETDFALIQIGGGEIARKKDKMFESHYAGAKSRGIPVGAYWFIDAKTVEQALEEADIALSIIAGKKFEYPIYLDLEKQSIYKTGKANVSKIIRAFLNKVESAGYWVGLYGNPDLLCHYTEDDIKTRYAIWLAEWDVSKPTYKGAYGIWQPDKAYRAGFPDKVDYDICYLDYPSMIKAKGLNGYGTTSGGKPPEDNSDAPAEPETPTAPAEPETPAAEQPEVAHNFSKTVAGAYKVTATALNVRIGAGTDKRILTTIPNGTTVRCYGYYNVVAGVKWLCIVVTQNGVTYTGYCSSQYLKRT